MKKVLILLLFVSASFTADAQEYKIITSVESVVPAGLGRSRLVEVTQQVNTDEVTTERTDGKKSDQGKVKRKDMKVDEFDEAKLLNFFSVAGINFQNIATNDALISDRLMKLTSEGWTLAFVTSAVESVGGADDMQGIFITRYIFKR